MVEKKRSGGSAKLLKGSGRKSNEICLSLVEFGWVRGILVASYFLFFLFKSSIYKIFSSPSLADFTRRFLRCRCLFHIVVVEEGQDGV